MEAIKMEKDSEESFESLILTVKLKLYKTGMAILKNDADTCDAIQETLISAYKNFDSLQTKEYFTTWIIRIMINKCYDIIRNNKKIAYINKQMELEETAYYERYSEESSLEKVLNKIDPDLKIVTVLYYYDDLSINEISSILNVPEGTVKSRLSRSRDKIFKIIKMEEGEING